MGYTQDREAFIARLAEEHVGVTRARIILANANKVQKIAADDCSNEWAYNAMEARRLRCPDCERDGPQDRTYDLTKPRRCPEHRAMAAIANAATGTAIQAIDYSGDPRGCCVKLRMASGRGDSWGDPSLLCVPTREY